MDEFVSFYDEVESYCDPRHQYHPDEFWNLRHFPSHLRVIDGEDETLIHKDDVEAFREHYEEYLQILSNSQ